MFSVNKASIKEKPVVANLLELYMYDLSKIVHNREIFSLDSNGRFGYPRFDSFWQDKDRAAYLFRLDQDLVGFCLVHSSSFFHRDVGSKVIGEFFILDHYRKQGLGSLAVKKVFSLYPGYWEMRTIDINTVAVQFWGKILRTICPDNYEINEKNDFEWIGKVFVGKVT